MINFSSLRGFLLFARFHQFSLFAEIGYTYSKLPTRQIYEMEKCWCLFVIKDYSTLKQMAEHSILQFSELCIYGIVTTLLCCKN